LKTGSTRNSLYTLEDLDHINYGFVGTSRLRHHCRLIFVPLCILAA